MTLISWFFKLFRNDNVSIISTRHGLEIHVGDYVTHNALDTPLDDAIMSFLAWYITEVKKGSVEYRLTTCKFCGFRVVNGYCNCLASQGVK